MDSAVIFTMSVVSILWLPNIFVWWLITRNIDTIKSTFEIPPNIKNYYTSHIFNEAKNHALKINWIDIVAPYFHCVNISILLVTGLAALLWRYINRQNEHYNLDKDFTVPALWIIILSLPYLVLYVLFYILNAFIEASVIALMQGLGLCLAITFSFLVDLVIAYMLAKYGGKAIFIKLGVFAMVTVLLLTWIYSFIQADQLPKRNLTDDDLENEIQNLAKQMGISSKKIYFQASNKTGAFHTGYLGSEIIVISDGFLKCTTCKNDNCSQKLVPCPSPYHDNVEIDGLIYKRRYTNNEVLSVLAHEGTHWIERHPIVLILLNEIIILTLALLCHFIYNSSKICRVFCIAVEECPDLIKFKLTLVLVQLPYMFVMNILTVVAIRQCEYRADYNVKRFGLVNDIISCLGKLHADNLAFPLADHMYSFFLLDHPTLMERIKALE